MVKPSQRGHGAGHLHELNVPYDPPRGELYRNVALPLAWHERYYDYRPQSVDAQARPRVTYLSVNVSEVLQVRESACSTRMLAERNGDGHFHPGEGNVGFQYDAGLGNCVPCDIGVYRVHLRLSFAAMLLLGVYQILSGLSLNDLPVCAKLHAV